MHMIDAAGFAEVVIWPYLELAEVVIYMTEFRLGCVVIWPNLSIQHSSRNSQLLKTLKTAKREVVFCDSRLDE